MEMGHEAPIPPDAAQTAFRISPISGADRAAGARARDSLEDGRVGMDLPSRSTLSAQEERGIRSTLSARGVHQTYRSTLSARGVRQTYDSTLSTQRVGVRRTNSTGEDNAITQVPASSSLPVLSFEIILAIPTMHLQEHNFKVSRLEISMANSTPQVDFLEHNLPCLIMLCPPLFSSACNMSVSWKFHTQSH